MNSLVPYLFEVLRELSDMELLAPAGNWSAFLAAIGNGADALYLGGSQFSARQGADNFSSEEIARALDYAHLRNKKIYVAVNTLIRDDEFDPALQFIYQMYKLGVDAIIIQDIGLLNATSQILPDLKLHASTQMTIHNTDAVRLVKEIGVKRVVLAREMTREEIRIVCQNHDDVEIEVFVHGALCFSYSGQCLFSSMVGGRSGNRGRCAQPCRQSYALTGSSNQLYKTRGNYLLSPADLSLIDNLTCLRDAGVHSLKIEGRMKRPEYVAVVTRVFRDALDNLDEEVSISSKNKLRQIFNRDFCTGYFNKDEPRVLSPQRPDNRGVYIGKIVSQQSDLLAEILLTERLTEGDGIEIRSTAEHSSALIISEIFRNGIRVAQADKGDLITIQLLNHVKSGDQVYKTSDKQLLTEAMNTIEQARTSKIEVDANVYLHENEPLRLVLKDGWHHQVTVLTDSKAVLAESTPVDETVLRGKLGRMGNTQFKLRNLHVHGPSNLIIPYTELNRVRRQGVENLMQLYHPERLVGEEEFQQNRKKWLSNLSGRGVQKEDKQLNVKVNSINDAYVALQEGVDCVYIGLSGIGDRHRINIRELSDLINWAVDHEKEIIPVLPLIEKPSDPIDYRKIIEHTGIQKILVQNLGAVQYCRENNIRFCIDYNLNAFNSFSLGYFTRLGAERITISPELSWQQIKKIYSPIELLIHGDLIIMTSETCVLGNVNTEGCSQTCHNYCQRDNYYLRDQKGYKFPLATDAECRFYVFNSRTLSLLDDLPLIMPLADSFRLDFYRHNVHQIKATVSIYREVFNRILAGEKFNIDEYKNRLIKYSPSAFTRGHYFRGVE
ncbi:MAG: DUF3656 domain-containing protein [Syntrophomonadaceae bacterium]|nr:DUF3656 domain-containing protein [Syntrophomonadaceae bacterium]